MTNCYLVITTNKKGDVLESKSFTSLDKAMDEMRFQHIHKILAMQNLSPNVSWELTDDYATVSVDKRLVARWDICEGC